MVIEVAVAVVLDCVQIRNKIQLSTKELILYTSTIIICYYRYEYI